MSVMVRPATRQDMEQFYPELDASFRAWVAEVDGKVAGMIGLALYRPFACLVSAVDDALRPHLKNIRIGRAIKKMERLCKEHKGGIIAIADPDEITAPEILSRIEFEYSGVVGADVIYVMRRG